MSKAEGLLNRGLAAGYAGRAVSEIVSNGPFETKRVVYTESGPLTDGNFYADQWLKGLQGGGQEVAWSSRDRSGATRLYAGGVVDDDRLIGSLGLDTEQILNQHKRFVADGVGRTRGRKPYSDTSGDWDYYYEVLAELEEQGIDLTIALETMTFKGDLVFAHGFLSNPIIPK